MTAAVEVDADAMIAALLEGPPSKLWDFEKTRENGEKVRTKIRMRILRVDENHDAIRAAQDYAKKRGELKEYGDIYREAQAVEVLSRAVCKPEKKERADKTRYYPTLFASSDHMRQQLDESDLRVLLNMYTITKAELGAIESLDDHTAEQWVAMLSDPLSKNHFLAHLDLLHWPGLIALLAGTAADLFRSLGVALPSSANGFESTPESSTGDTGCSSEQPSA